MGIRHAKPYTLRGGPSTKLDQRLFKAWQLNNHSKNSSIPSKPDRAHICTISGAICGTREITPPSGFSAVPITTTMFAATTPENTPMAYHASTSANLNPVISPTFVESNYEALESLLKDRCRKMRNNDLRTELEYFSEDYDKERDMEPRPEPTRAATPPLRVESPRIRRRGKEQWAHLGRGKNGQPLQSPFTSAYGDQALSNNIGGNILSNDMFLSHHAQPFISASPTEDVYEDASSCPLQREGESTRAFITRYTDDTLQILGLHEEQRISGFVHGLRIKSLVEYLSTDLPSTYKGLIEKTYTWVEVREKNKDRFSPYRGPNHGLLPSLSKSLKEILATEKAARSFEPPPKMFGSKRSRDMSKYGHFYEDYGHDTNDCKHLITQIQEAVNSGQLSHLVKGIKKERTKSSDTLRGESKKDKGTRPAEAPILMVSREAHITKSLAQENTDYGGKEIIFPPVAKVNNAPVIIEAKIFQRKVRRVYMDSGSSCEIIYEHCFEKLNPTIKATKVDLKTPLVGFSGERSWSIGEVTLEITIGDSLLSRTETRNFIIVRSDSSHNMLLRLGIVVLTIDGAIKFHVTPPKFRTTQRNGNIGVLLQGTKHKSRKTTLKWTF
ncbi:reverse transcriptase domain-containing protein [Tanacetum coccineum]